MEAEAHRAMKMPKSASKPVGGTESHRTGRKKKSPFKLPLTSPAYAADLAV